MKNGQELLETLEEELEWGDEWEDIVGIQDAEYTDNPTNPFKESWNYPEEYKYIWRIEVVTYFKSRNGKGLNDPDRDISTVKIEWEWCDEGGKWHPDYIEGLPEYHCRDNAYVKFREWVERRFPYELEEIDQSNL